MKGHAGHELNERRTPLANGAARATRRAANPARPRLSVPLLNPLLRLSLWRLPAVEVPIVNAPAAEPALSDVALSESVPF